MVVMFDGEIPDSFMSDVPVGRAEKSWLLGIVAPVRRGNVEEDRRVEPLLSRGRPEKIIATDYAFFAEVEGENEAANARRSFPSYGS
jgi:hypothetical protein